MKGLEIFLILLIASTTFAIEIPEDWVKIEVDKTTRKYVPVNKNYGTDNFIWQAMLLEDISKKAKKIRDGIVNFVFFVRELPIKEIKKGERVSIKFMEKDENGLEFWTGLGQIELKKYDDKGQWIFQTEREDMSLFYEIGKSKTDIEVSLLLEEGREKYSERIYIMSKEEVENLKEILTVYRAYLKEKYRRR